MIIQAQTIQIGLYVSISRIIQQQPSPLEFTARRRAQEINGQTFVKSSLRILDSVTDQSWLAEGGLTLAEMTPTIYPVVAICSALIFKMRVVIFSHYPSAHWVQARADLAHKVVIALLDIPGWGRRCGRLLDALRESWEHEMPTPNPNPQDPEVDFAATTTMANGDPPDLSDMWNEFLFGGLGSLDGVGWVDFANLAATGVGQPS